MEKLQTRWSIDDAERLIEAIETAQEHTQDEDWNRDVQVIKARLLTGLARAVRRGAVAAGT